MTRVLSLPPNATLRAIGRAEQSSITALSKTFCELGWPSGLQRVPRDSRPRRIQLQELCFASEPAALIALGSAPNRASLASAGYTRQARYVVAWSPDEVALFDTLLWKSEPADLPLFQAQLNDRYEISYLLSLLSPDNVLEEVPSDLIPNEDMHAALPKVLGDALNNLRLQVADSSAYSGNDPAESDTEVLRLFHQLLYVRIAEDRGTARSESRIQNVMEHKNVGEQLEELLKDYRDQANSELFNPVSISVAHLPTSPLRDVLRQTVEPWKRLRLDFTLARADLAGKLYESYLAALPAQEPDEKRAGRLFQLARGVDKREKQATFYTPPALARLLCDRTLGTKLSGQGVELEDIRIVDTACGSGAFLTTAYFMLQDYLEARKGRTLRPAERERILLECIFGADVDERAIGLAQVQLLEVANLHGRLPTLRKNLFCGDSLPAPPGVKAGADEVPWDEIVGERGLFTIALGNPPFGSQVKLPMRLSIEQISALVSQYPEVRAFGQDYAYYFLALSMRLLETDGYAGLVMPRPLLSLAAGKRARKFLAEAGVSYVTDFRATHVFPHVGASIATVVVDRTVPDETRIEGLQDSREDPRGAIDALMQGSEKGTTSITISHTRLKEIAETGWTPFRVRWFPQLESMLARKTAPLGAGSMRDVRTGVKPGRVEDFVLGPDDWRAVKSKSVVVGEHVLPERFLPQVVYASDVRPFKLEVSGRRLFLPFEQDGSASSNPDVVNALKARGGLPTNYRHGYLPTLCGPKILLRAVAREPASVSDPTGQFVPIMRGVHAIRMDDIKPEHLRGIAALLNSSFYQWLLRGLGSPRSDETIELTLSDVRGLPVPEFSTEELSELCSFADGVKEAIKEENPVRRVKAVRNKRADLDNYVIELLCVSAIVRNAIQEELIREA